MSTIREQVQKGRRVLGGKSRPDGPGGRRLPGRRLGQLEARVAELEAELQESRQLHRRLAELTDVVQELLLPVAQRDDEALRERLERYSSSL